MELENTRLCCTCYSVISCDLKICPHCKTPVRADGYGETKDKGVDDAVMPKRFLVKHRTPLLVMISIIIALAMGYIMFFTPDANSSVNMVEEVPISATFQAVDQENKLIRMMIGETRVVRYAVTSDETENDPFSAVSEYRDLADVEIIDITTAEDGTVFIDVEIVGVAEGKSKVLLRTPGGEAYNEEVGLTISGPDTVFVFVTIKGSKYHYKENCGGVKMIEVLLRVVEPDWGPCKRCVK